MGKLLHLCGSCMCFCKAGAVVRWLFLMPYLPLSHFFRHWLWKNLIFSECLKYPKGHDTNKLIRCNFVTRQWFSCFFPERLGILYQAADSYCHNPKKGLHIQMTGLGVPRKYLTWTVYIRSRTAVWRSVGKFQSLLPGPCLHRLKCSEERKPVLGSRDMCIAELAEAVTIGHDVTPHLWGLCDNPELHLPWEPGAHLKPTEATSL